MNESEENSIELQRESAACDYCGAELDERHSFCITCATPYKPTESVLPTVPAHYVNDQMRVESIAPQAMTIFYWFLNVLVVSGSIAYLLSDSIGEYEAQIFAEIVLILLTMIFSFIYFQPLFEQLRVPGFFTKGAFEAAPEIRARS